MNGCNHMKDYYSVSLCQLMMSINMMSLEKPAGFCVYFVQTDMSSYEFAHEIFRDSGYIKNVIMEDYISWMSITLQLARARHF